MLMESMGKKLAIAVLVFALTTLTGCATPRAEAAPKPAPVAAISPDQAFINGVRKMDPVPPAHVKDAEILNMGNALCKKIRTGDWDGFNVTDPYAVNLIRLAKQTIC